MCICVWSAVSKIELIILNPLLGVLISHKHTHIGIPLAAVRTRPLQYLELAHRSSICTSIGIPLAAVRTRPLKNFQVSACSCICTSIGVPLAAVGTSPLQSLELSASSCLLTASANDRVTSHTQRTQKLQFPPKPNTVRFLRIKNKRKKDHRLRRQKFASSHPIWSTINILESLETKPADENTPREIYRPANRI